MTWRLTGIDKGWSLFIFLQMNFSTQSPSQIQMVDTAQSSPLGSFPTPECALLLTRTYVTQPAEASFLPQFTMRHGYVDSSTSRYEICISYRDVNSALAEAKRKLNYRHSQVESMEPDAADIDLTALLTIETTKILAKRFHLTHDEISHGLPMIDTSRTDIWNICPAHVKPIPCTMGRFRSMTGHCNNVQQSTWGASNTPFVRFMPPAYANGIDSLRVSTVDGSELPNARKVSSTIHKDRNIPSQELSVLVMSWGQFIDHDLTLAAPPRDANELDVFCCRVPVEQRHHTCIPLNIPPNDPFYSKHRIRCMDFKRTLAGQMPGCALGPRVHINLLTAAIDANFVYGSTEELARQLRQKYQGMMKVWNKFQEYGMKPLLPPYMKNAEKDCIARPRNLYCFLAGDERVNEQIHLTVLHTLYVRDHNRMASELGVLNPHWDDDRIYHETRHIMAASVQHITYNEFLPMVVGKDLMRRYNLTVQTEGYWNGYDPNTHMGLANCFQSSAFRFGHTHIQSRVRRYNKNHEFIDAMELRDLLRHPFILYQPGMMDELIGGLINTPAQSYDPFVTSEVTNHLFQEPPEPFGMDLAAINLLRGREHGVPGYNYFREWCGLPRAKTFADLEPWLSNGTVLKYSQLYKHPDDIDLWSAGVSERVLPSAMVGPTFACIIARQFSHLKMGDRFWYENSGFPSSFTPGQLQEIKKATQAKIICENADDMPTIQKWVMKLPHPSTNPRLKCEELPSLDLRYWQEDPIHGGFNFKK